MKQYKRKHSARLAKRVIFGIFGTIFLLIIAGAGFLGVKGYLMYQNAVKEMPIPKIGETVRNREGFTSYEELPSIYIDAVIASEDQRFMTHCGIDVIAIARAAWTDLTTLSFAEGGSTITQQIAKNQLFSQEKQMERKAAEIFAAFALEKEYSKKELFEIYVNSIYFGSGYYGVHDAAQGYFQKDPKDLTDYEAVLLAGLPNAPSAYSPDHDMELARKRTSIVLYSMIRCGSLTEEKADQIWAMENNGDRIANVGKQTEWKPAWQ